MATFCGLLAAMALGVAPLLLSALEQKEALAPAGPLAAQSASAEAKAEVARTELDVGDSYRGSVVCEGYLCAPTRYTNDGGIYFERLYGWNAGEEAVYTFDLPARVKVEMADDGGQQAILELGGTHNYSQPTDHEVTIGTRGDLGNTTLRWISGDRQSWGGSWRVTIRSIGCPEPKPICEGDCQNIAISCGMERCNCQVEPCGCLNSWAVIHDDNSGDAPAARAEIKFQAPTTVFLDIPLGAYDSEDHIILGNRRYPDDPSSRYQVHIGGTSEQRMYWNSAGGIGAGRFWAVMGPYNPPHWWQLHWGWVIAAVLLACSFCCCYNLYWTQRPASARQGGEVQM